jgi:hypothetical protein
MALKVLRWELEAETMSNKIVVPDGMLKAAMAARNAHFIGDDKRIELILEEALRWQSENPKVPTEKEWAACLQDACREGSGISPVMAWVLRMYLAPEPEVPEEIKDILDRTVKGDFDVIEAFRRGQKAGLK